MSEADFGYDQAHMVTVPNNADIQTIVDRLATLKDTYGQL